MNYFGIDHLIVYAFLIITLIIGIRAGRGIKDMREYVLANKSFGTLALLLTFLATNIGSGSVVGAASEIFSAGIIRMFATSGVAISLMFIAVFIAPRMKYFDNCLTIGDVIGNNYGSLSQIITGLLGVFYSIAMVSMQILGLNIICTDLLQLDTMWGIVIGGIVLTIYSAYGGIKSVTVTDIFQFIILVVVFPLITTIALKHVGGVGRLFVELPKEKLIFWGHENFSSYLAMFIVWSIFPVGITSPPLFQRMLMARSGNELRKQYWLATAFDPLFRLLIMLIALSAVILYPYLPAKSVLTHVIQDLLPIGAKGLAIAGLLAVILSTADSYLHTAGVVLVHDVLKPICKKRNSTINELPWAQISTLIIGVISIAIAIQGINSKMTTFSMWAVKFTGPLLMFPLIATLFGLQSDKQTLYLASIGTILAFFTTSWLLPSKHVLLSGPISILINGIFFFGIHWIRHKRFIFSYTK